MHNSLKSSVNSWNTRCRDKIQKINTQKREIIPIFTYHLQIYLPILICFNFQNTIFNFHFQSLSSTTIFTKKYNLITRTIFPSCHPSLVAINYQRNKKKKSNKENRFYLPVPFSWNFKRKTHTYAHTKIGDACIRKGGSILCTG